MNAISCKDCGTEVTSSKPDEPCPSCGSANREIRVVIELASEFDTALPLTAIITTVESRLFDTVDRLFDAGEHDVAVIVAATACEVVVDRAFAAAFAKKGVPELDDPIGKVIGTNALVREQNRKLYEALTGDQIGQAAFWAGYRTLVEHRNAIAHKGTKISRNDARKDIDNAKLFVEHVVKHNGLE